MSERESHPVVRAFAFEGIRSGILYYDVASDILGVRPLQQAAWAVAKIRELYPGEPVTVLGFSAGAHCAGNLGVHFRGFDWKGENVLASLCPEAKTDPLLFRPDGMVLCYPVISAYEHAHLGSILRLAGPFGKQIAEAEEYQQALRWMSLETQVTKETPPAFLWHTQEDDSVPVQNSLLFAEALMKAGVTIELHIYPYGKHGLSLVTEEVSQPEKGRLADAHVAGWFPLMVEWLKQMKLVV